MEVLHGLKFGSPWVKKLVTPTVVLTAKVKTVPLHATEAFGGGGEEI
jgi:hypothetical protein